MLLNKITLDDFGVYGGHNEFELASESNRPIVLCKGTNGAGKTTLFNSVLLCLYGQRSFESKITQTIYHQKIHRLFHRYAKKSTHTASISLEFQYIHDGKVTQYKVTRLWENNIGRIKETLYIKSRYSQDHEYANLESINGAEQYFIDQLLPIGIARLFFFDGEKIQEIARSGTEGAHIKSSFDALLGLDLVSMLSQDIGLYMVRNSGGESKRILQEIDENTTKKQNAESRIDNLQAKQIELKAQANSLQNKLTIKEDEFSKLGGEFAEKRQEHIAQKAKIEVHLEEVKKCIHELCSDTLPFCIIPENLKRVHSKIHSDMQKTRQALENEILNDVYSDLYTKLEKPLEKYGSDTKQEIIEQIQQIKKERENTLPKKLDLSLDMSPESIMAMTLLIDDINKYDIVDLKNAIKKYDELKKSLADVNIFLARSPMKDEIAPLFSEITQISREIGEIEHEIEHLSSLEAQETSSIVLINAKIRQYLSDYKNEKRRVSGLDLAPNVQKVLEEYAQALRLRKVSLLEASILNGLQRLFHKTNFVNHITINPETFEIKLYRDNDDEITRDMLSEGELQIYATAIIWGLAKTSSRSIPFIIDTPLARLDMSHRDNLISDFYPFASHQMIIFSTDSEITESYYKRLDPHISKSFTIEYEPESGRTIQHKEYPEEQEIEVR